MGSHCLAHVTDTEFHGLIERYRTGTQINARFVEMTPSLLDRLLRNLMDSERGVPVLPRVDFGGARFPSDADFQRAVFGEPARFSEARFEGAVNFRDTTFEGPARFRETQFSGEARFGAAVFADAAYFGDARFEGPLRFSGVTCKKVVSFLRARWLQGASLAEAQFEDNLRFNDAELDGPMDLTRSRFHGRTEFLGTVLNGSLDATSAEFAGLTRWDGVRCSLVNFKGASFDRDSRFHAANFSQPASFKEVQFRGRASFAGADFSQRAEFELTECHREADFSKVVFDGPAGFGGAVFRDLANFEDVAFKANARFARARFLSDTSFDGAHCRKDAKFARAIFERSRAFQGFSARGGIDLDGAVFGGRPRIELRAPVIYARRAAFSEGVHLEVTEADIVLDDADFARQSILIGAAGSADQMAKLLSLSRAHVSALVLSGLDLRACRFSGAQGLSSMRVEANCLWPSSPSERWLSHRRTTSEEHRWRVQQGDENWDDPATRWSEQAGAAGVPGPAEIAGVYRALRKAREDDKDEAGAGDLYYGEMEMRRLAGGGVKSEQGILWGYWLVSGYGLRASRAVVWLAIVLTLAAALFCCLGFQPPHEPNFGRALLFALESSVSLLHPPRASLTLGGEVVQVVLRLLGPLLVGLALLAVRARVKR